MPEPTDTLKEKRVELILQQLEELPTLPGVALKVLEATADDHTDAEEVVKLISTDQSLSTRILQLVHRAGSGVRGEVNSVERAVVLLGFEAVRSAVLAVTIFQTLGGDGPTTTQSSFSREEFWKHSLAVGCCAELLSDALRTAWGSAAGVDPADAFTCGLLHDLGKVALDAMLPKSFSKVVEAADMLRGNIADIERSVIGLDHMVVGKRLAERWRLPDSIRDCAWLHGQIPQALPATVKNPRLVNLITLADVIVREQHLGFSGNFSFSVPKQALLDAVGLTPEQLEPVMKKLITHIEPRANALGLGQASTTELYQQAISQANIQLAKVTGQLAAKNKRLSIRAKFFDALSQFHNDLRADAPSQIVVQAIGQTAMPLIGASAAVAFSIPPGQAFAEVLYFDATGSLGETTFIDCAVRPAKPAQAENPVRRAGEELEWLLSAVSPRLAEDCRFWVCLQTETSCIGGVIWGAKVGEIERLASQASELAAITGGWSLALRTAQIRDESRALTEQLAEANRQLQTAHSEILRSKTLTTVGEMAAGAAHEMNNPLAVISGRSQLLAQQITDPKLSASAKAVAENAQKLSDIVSELMSFAKPTPPKPIESDVADILSKALTEAKRRTEVADRKIEVTVSDVPQVRVDPEQVISAIAEMMDNALQATDEKKGRVQISAAFDPYSNRVAITVADDGVGMDENTLKRAFDPFFSSKPAGRRRGLGLAKALRLIESSGGTVRLDSRVGAGTRALVLLPAAKKAAAGATTAQGSARKAAK
jgi:signal transduction histidine kinase/HD-like signal output (HDOD) protein